MATPSAAIITASKMLLRACLNEAAWPRRVRLAGIAALTLVVVVSMRRRGHAECGDDIIDVGLYHPKSQ